LPGKQEGFLCDLFATSAIAQYGVRDRAHHTLMLPHQPLELVFRHEA
jgi:hypothetical protein